MTDESGKPGSYSSHDADKHKHLERDIKDMVNAITSRVTDLHKSRSVHEEDEDEQGVRVITLAGSNTGATLRSELDDENNKPAGLHGGPTFGDQPDGLNTYVNSNFQAINNSLMMGGSYTTNDPGVRVDITDVVEPHGHPRPEKRGWKGKKKEKEKEGFHSDQHHEHDEE